MAQLFKKGDVVNLKSGGPDMTIEKYESIIFLDAPPRESQDIVECIWFNGHEKKWSKFHQDTLEKLED